MKDLSKNGLASIEYPSGHTDYLDVAVRCAVLTGVNQTSLKAQEALAEEMGCDLVDVTAHSGARTGVGIANHAGWQGKRYSRSGTDQKHPSLVSVTGYGTGQGLGGWNCRHNMFPAFEGTDPPYTQDELDDLNAKKHEYNGQKLTEYEASQVQRKIERNIRKWKREYIGMKAAGQPTDEAAANLAHWRKVEKDFLKQTGLKQQPEREIVEGFGRSQARCAVVDSVRKSDIINRPPSTAGGHISPESRKSDVQFVGRIDREIFKVVSDGITTDEVIITDERIGNILDRHPKDLERYQKYLREIIETPDYIVEANKPASAVLLKEFEENGKKFQAILRLHTNLDDPANKNSIITFMKIREKEWKRLLNNKKVLYKRV